MRRSISLGLAVAFFVVAVLYFAAWKNGQTAEFAWFAGIVMILFSLVFLIVFGFVISIWSWTACDSLWDFFFWGDFLLLRAMNETGARWPLWWFAGIPIAIAGVYLVYISGLGLSLPRLPW